MNYELDHEEIHDGLRRLCQDFPGSFWRQCDRGQAYTRSIGREEMKYRWVIVIEIHAAQCALVIAAYSSARYSD